MTGERIGKRQEDTKKKKVNGKVRHAEEVKRQQEKGEAQATRTKAAESMETPRLSFRA